MFYARAEHQRRAHDHYSTPKDLAQALPIGLKQAGIELPAPIYDPCAGEGALLDALRPLPGFGSDLFPNEYNRHLRILETPVDASDPETLADALGFARSIVTNPPYGREALGVVRTGVELIRRGQAELAAFLLPLPWTAAQGRLTLMRNVRLQITCCWRPEWVAGTGGGGKMNSAWLVWTRESSAFPISVYLDRKDVA
jgi:hypothetical protein